MVSFEDRLDHRSAVLHGTLGVRSGTFPAAWPVAVRKLSYRDHSFRRVLRPLLCSHCTEEAQVAALNGKVPTPFLEVADGTMPVQDERGWFPTTPKCGDGFNSLLRS